MVQITHYHFPSSNPLLRFSSRGCGDDGRSRRRRRRRRRAPPWFSLRSPEAPSQYPLPVVAAAAAAAAVVVLLPKYHRAPKHSEPPAEFPVPFTGSLDDFYEAPAAVSRQETNRYFESLSFSSCIQIQPSRTDKH